MLCLAKSHPKDTAMDKQDVHAVKIKAQPKVSSKLFYTYLVAAVFPINVSCMIVAKLRFRAPELVAVESVKGNRKNQSTKTK